MALTRVDVFLAAPCCLLSGYSKIMLLRVWLSVFSTVELAHLLSILEASIANPIRT